MDYEKLIPVLVKATQELKSENYTLKAQLQAMQQRLEKLARPGPAEVTITYPSPLSIINSNCPGACWLGLPILICRNTMPAQHTNPVPRNLPFDAGSFAWEHFERFCAAWFVSGTSLPNFSLSGTGPSRLRILDAVRYGTGGAKQRGIDILATMEDRATWVVQCKRTPKFTRGDTEKAILKAESEYGSRQPAHWLLWVTGSVSTDALDFVHEHHPTWTLWDGERLSQEFLLHTPRRQAFQIIESVFGSEWAKAFFPLPDSLLITAEEFFSRWAGAERLFHHRTAFVGRQELLDRMTAFGSSGKGSKALILSAAGGIGKTRLLRAAAECIEAEAPDRVVRFTNPEALHAEPPRYEDAANVTVFHDDAHRLDTIPPLLLGVMAKALANGARLILAARPGAEDALRELLMSSGWQSKDIETLKVGKLTRPEMEELAASCLGSALPEAARPLAQLSEGCALITLVGAELLRRGELTHLDLVRSDHFRAEVFRRFEGQELDRVRGSLDRPLMEKLLRSIALLSPWPGCDAATAQAMADFLGIQRGQVDAACDSLLSGGLLVRTRDGYRITPDLFSDHLAYAACYDANGQSTAFIRPFLDRFAEEHSQTVMRNLAEAEWRALQQHGSGTASVIAPVWQRFLKDFSRASFWQRSTMLGHWAGFAFYQPERTLELAGWAMELTTAPPYPHFREYDQHSIVMGKVQSVLIPVAIWSEDHRQRALDMLWRLRRDFPSSDSHNKDSGYGCFASVASFHHNFPAAANGVLDWLEHLLAGPDAALAADRPSGFIESILQSYFVRFIEQNYMRDHRTFVFSNVPVSVYKTKAVRQRAIRILTEQVVPRGTVAAINALPSLGDAFHQPVWGCELSASEIKAWLPEKRRALQAIREVGERYQHPLVHLRIRRLLRWQIVFGKHQEFQPACTGIATSLPDTFQLRLARVTLNWYHDDSLDRHREAPSPDKHEHEKHQWDALAQSVVSQLLEKHDTAERLHLYLSQWYATCAEHGFTPRMSELLTATAQQNGQRALELLDYIHQHPASILSKDAADLIGTADGTLSEEQERAVLRGFACDQPSIVCSFLSAAYFRRDMRTVRIVAAIVALAGQAQGSVLSSLIGMLRHIGSSPWENQLIHAILSRSITDKEAEQLTNVVSRHVQYGDGQLGPGIAAALLDRLSRSAKIEASDYEPGFIHMAAERFPRLLFNILHQRIESAEARGGSDSLVIRPLPYCPALTLGGLEQESDFEQLARDLLKRLRAAPAEIRSDWESLFAMSVSKTSPLLETLLMEWLPTVKDSEELAELSGLTKFEGSLVMFRFPALTEAILRRARDFGPESLDRITWELILSAGPQMRTYTNGELDAEHRYMRDEAEKAIRVHETNPELRSFFRKVLENEIRDEGLHRRRAEEDGYEW